MICIFCVIDAISSVEAEVSSSDAACSEAPCASDRLDPDTWPAAVATFSALRAMRPARSCRPILIWRTIQKMKHPTAIADIAITTIRLRRRDDLARRGFGSGRQFAVLFIYERRRLLGDALQPGLQFLIENHQRRIQLLVGHCLPQLLLRLPHQRCLLFHSLQQRVTAPIRGELPQFGERALQSVLRRPELLLICV